MKKLRYIIIGLVILLITLIGIVIFILSKTKNEYDKIEQGSIPQDTLIQLENYSTKETNENVFFTISDIIQQSLKNDEKNYYAQEMYKIQTHDKAIYYTYGLIQEKNTLQNYYLKIRIDNNNNAYAIETLDMKEYEKAKKGNINEIQNTEIVKTKDNYYQINNFSSEEIARRYVKDYMIKVRYMPNTAFELLENEYRNKKFKGIEDFKKYIQKNTNRFSNFIMEKYQCEVKENSLEYTILDSYENYYKITVYDTLNYEVILDNYTNEDTEYIKKYENAKEENKVSACISKFIKQINAKEYIQAYGYLDETFKKNNFDTVEKFESYMKKYLFDYNIETIQSVEKLGNVYSCRVNIKSGVGLSAEEKNITIIMKLKEGTDFVMSFNIK